LWPVDKEIGEGPIEKEVGNFVKVTDRMEAL
jgi:hypothetical protein